MHWQMTSSSMPAALFGYSGRNDHGHHRLCPKLHPRPRSWAAGPDPRPKKRDLNTPASPLRSRPAERGFHLFVWLWELGVASTFQLVLIGSGEDREQLVHSGEIVLLHRCRDHRFDLMVARDVGRIDGAHRRAPGFHVLHVLLQALTPAGKKRVAAGAILEQRAQRLVPRSLDLSIREPSEE